MDELRKTCLYDRHVALGAQMSPFAGYSMPIQYSSIITEHNAVRGGAGMFDVSHMGEIFVSGSDALKFVNHVFSNDASTLEGGKAMYGMLINGHGGIVDDLLVYREFGPDLFLLVVNAANIAKDRAWLVDHADGFCVVIDDQSDKWGQIALQGPGAVNFLGLLNLEACSDLVFYTFRDVDAPEGRLIVSRTGYTGEDGFEIYGPHAAIRRIWDTLIEAGVTPCGLGCRDTLRFEAGLPLYGHEMDDSVTPYEAGLGIFVKLDKEEFIGKEALVAAKATGLKRKLVGIELDDRAVARAGYDVLSLGEKVGTVTTGYHSITLDKSVCVAMVDRAHSELGTRVQIQIRKKVFDGTVCKKRFYSPNYRK